VLTNLLDIIAIAWFALLSGADSWVAIETYGNAKRSWLDPDSPYRTSRKSGQGGWVTAAVSAVEAFLWQGDVDSALGQFNDWQHERVSTFVAYLNKHQRRIVRYGYYQGEGISIGSGAIEPTVKQIGRRIKLSGAHWEKDNVPQVLKHRSAYLNGQFSK